jgi:hypothetical protein
MLAGGPHPVAADATAGAPSHKIPAHTTTHAYLETPRRLEALERR